MQSVPILLSFIALYIIAISCVILWVLIDWYVGKKLGLVKQANSVNQSSRIIQFLYNQRQNHPYWHSVTLGSIYLVGITIALVATFSNPWLLEFNGEFSYLVDYTFLYVISIIGIWYYGRDYARKPLESS